MNNMSSNSISIPVNSMPTHIVVWQDMNQNKTSDNNSYESMLMDKISNLTRAVSMLIERVTILEDASNRKPYNGMDELNLPPSSSYCESHSPKMQSSSSYKSPSAPRSPFFPPMVSPEPVGLSVRPRETTAQIFTSLLKHTVAPLPDIKYDLNAYTNYSDSESVKEIPKKVNIVKVDSEESSIYEEEEREQLEEVEEEKPIVPILYPTPEKVDILLIVPVKEEVVEKEEEVVKEEQQEGSHQEEEVVEEEVEEEEVEVVEEEVVEEEVVEEVEDEVVEEEEAQELTEFEYKGKTYYRDADNQVYVQDADGDLNDNPIGVWNPEKNKILKYA